MTEFVINNHALPWLGPQNTLFKTSRTNRRLIDACVNISFTSDLDKAGRQESFYDEVDAEKDLRGINVINIFIGPQNASRNYFFVLSYKLDHLI